MQFAQTHQLHQRVTQCCRLIWARDHWHLKRISQPLVEPGVACASTQDMYLIDYSTCKPADVVKHLAIAQHEAFHDTPGKGCWCRRRPLPMFHKIGVDRGWHILWGQEARIVRIDEGREWRDTIHICQQRVIVCGMTSTCPETLAFLQQPQSHHVLEEAGR